MDELPSVSLSSWGRGRHRGSHNGRGVGRGLHLYSSLNSHDAGDEVPLISPSEERGGLHGGEVWESSGEEDLLEQTHWTGRKRWQQRIRTQSSLVGWFFDGGWQLLLKK